MVYRVVFLPRSGKEFKKLPPFLKDRIASLLEKIGSNPFLGKPLKGEYKGLHSIRIASYRVVYKIERKKYLVVIFKIGHRREVYR